MFGAFGAFFAVVLPLYYLKKYPNTEYLLTNKRLIIRSEFSKRFEFLSLFDSMVQGLNSWFAELGEIKEIRVKKLVTLKTLMFGVPEIWANCEIFKIIDESFKPFNEKDWRWYLRFKFLKTIFNPITWGRQGIRMVLGILKFIL